MNSPFIFAKEDLFFAYPNNFNHFVKYFKNTYQHGGVSLEEIIIPCAVYTPKQLFLGVKKIYTLLEVDQIAREIIELISGKVVLFYGQMGVGKTTLIKEICKSLHAEDVISSPTFSLVNEYRTQNDEPIYHFDFYRIESEEEALDIGVEDYFYSGDWCLIEWPNNIENLLPLDAVEIHLSHAAEGKRSIQLIQN